MHLDKSHYSLEEAAEVAKCRPGDLLHYAAQRKISLLVGVPDWVDVRIYDETTNSDTEPFLMSPELLVLAQSHCLKIELNGKTEQSDFPEGYIIEFSGKLKRILPSYGHPELNYKGVFWRTFRNRLVSLLELVPERLFVRHADLTLLISPDIKPAEATKTTETTRKSKNPNIRDTPIQRDSSDTIGDEPFPSGNVTRNDLDTKQQKAQDVENSPLSEKSPTILRMKQVLTRTGLSRATIYDRMNQKSPRFDPTFPKQVSLGVGSVGWIESELDTWIDSLRNKGNAKTKDAPPPLSSASSGDKDRQSQKERLSKSTHTSTPEKATASTSSTKESKDERVERLRKRKIELKDQGVKNFNQVLAKEEGVTEVRIKQLLKKSSLLEAVLKAATPTSRKN